MASQITRKLFTIDDCYKMAEVGILSHDERTELINGEILVVPPPGPRHGFALVDLPNAMGNSGKSLLDAAKDFPEVTALLRAALQKDTAVAPLTR